jgi:hypothetical protein
VVERCYTTFLFFCTFLSKGALSLNFGTLHFLRSFIFVVGKTQYIDAVRLFLAIVQNNKDGCNNGDKGTEATGNVH